MLHTLTHTRTVTIIVKKVSDTNLEVEFMREYVFKIKQINFMLYKNLKFMLTSFFFRCSHINVEGIVNCNSIYLLV